MKYCRIRLSLKVSHADAGLGRSDIKESKKATKGVMQIQKGLCVKRGGCVTASQCHNAVKIPAWFHNRTGNKVRYMVMSGRSLGNIRCAGGCLSVLRCSSLGVLQIFVNLVLQLPALTLESLKFRGFRPFTAYDFLKNGKLVP